MTALRREGVLNRRKFVLFAVLAALSSLSISLSAAESSRPNIVFILADDLGYTDIGCYGSKYYETPCIDKLASEGKKFTSAYTCGANCVPTRAALMTGQYGPRTGMYTVGGIDRFNWRSRPLRPVDNVEILPADKVTVAEALRRAGYATGLVGKWHLGNKAHPQDRGFDEFFGFLGGMHSYTNGSGIMRGREAVQEKEYLTDAFGREAIDFVRRHKDKPFFLYLAFNAVHTPLQSPKKELDHFKDKDGVGGHDNPVYAGMISSLDSNVGRLMAVLEELKLIDNTLVIFSSDNGGVGGYRRENISDKDITDNLPLRGGKGMFYEGGIRVPCIFKWPGRIKAGTSSDEPIISVDLYPTLLDAAGVVKSEGHILDGMSFLDVLTDKGAGARKPLFWHFPGYLGAGSDTWRTTPVGAVRSGDWKLLEFFETGKVELYNLNDDIGEKNDLAEANADKTAELLKTLRDWRKAINAPMPTAVLSTGSDE